MKILRFFKFIKFAFSICGMAKLEEIAKERFRWLGHVIRMKDCRIPNQALNWNLDSTNRKPERPRKKLTVHYPKGFKGYRIDLG